MHRHSKICIICDCDFATVHDVINWVSVWYVFKIETTTLSSELVQIAFKDLYLQEKRSHALKCNNAAWDFISYVMRLVVVVIVLIAVVIPIAVVVATVIIVRIPVIPRLFRLVANHGGRPRHRGDI